MIASHALETHDRLSILATLPTSLGQWQFFPFHIKRGSQQTVSGVRLLDLSWPWVYIRHQAVHARNNCLSSRNRVIRKSLVKLEDRGVLLDSLLRCTATLVFVTEGSLSSGLGSAETLSPCTRLATFFTPNASIRHVASFSSTLGTEMFAVAFSCIDRCVRIFFSLA